MTLYNVDFDISEMKWDNSSLYFLNDSQLLNVKSTSQQVLSLWVLFWWDTFLSKLSTFRSEKYHCTLWETSNVCDVSDCIDFLIIVIFLCFFNLIYVNFIYLSSLFSHLMRNCFNVLNKDLKSFSKWECLVSIIDEDYLFLFKNCFNVILKHLHEVRKYFNWWDIAIMSIINTEDTSQKTKEILEILKEVSKF